MHDAQVYVYGKKDVVKHRWIVTEWSEVKLSYSFHECRYKLYSVHQAVMV